MDNRQILALIRKYNSGRCTAEEKQFLEQWYRSQEWESLRDAPGAEELASLKASAWMRLQQARGPKEPPVRRLIPAHLSNTPRQCSHLPLPAPSITWRNGNRNRYP